MFDGFADHELPTGRGSVFARVGGDGPPLLLLHGYPQTHLMWHATAPLLADRYTVVVADLPGYGASFRPAPTPDHAAHSKRALALDLVEAMAGPRPRPLRGRGARPRRPGGLPDGAGPSRPRERCRGPRRRAHRRGVGPRRRRDGARLLALGVPRPARAAARAPDRRRPRRVLRPPRPGARPRPRTRPLPGGPGGGLPRPARRPGHRGGDLRGLPRRGRRRPRPRRRRPRSRAGSSARSSPCGAPAVRCRACTATCSRCGGRGPARPPAGGSTRATSSSRTSPSRSPILPSDFLRRSVETAASIAEEMTDMTEMTPTIVLVHGAYADSSSWNGVSAARRRPCPRDRLGQPAARPGRRRRRADRPRPQPRRARGARRPLLRRRRHDQRRPRTPATSSPSSTSRGSRWSRARAPATRRRSPPARRSPTRSNACRSPMAAPTPTSPRTSSTTSSRRPARPRAR